MCPVDWLESSQVDFSRLTQVDSSRVDFSPQIDLTCKLLSQNIFKQERRKNYVKSKHLLHTTTKYNVGCFHGKVRVHFPHCMCTCSGVTTSVSSWLTLVKLILHFDSFDDFFREINCKLYRNYIHFNCQRQVNEWFVKNSNPIASWLFKWKYKYKYQDKIN